MTDTLTNGEEVAERGPERDHGKADAETGASADVPRPRKIYALPRRGAELRHRGRFRLPKRPAVQHRSGGRPEDDPSVGGGDRGVGGTGGGPAPPQDFWRCACGLVRGWRQSKAKP